MTGYDRYKRGRRRVSECGSFFVQQGIWQESWFCGMSRSGKCCWESEKSFFCHIAGEQEKGTQEAL